MVYKINRNCVSKQNVQLSLIAIIQKQRPENKLIERTLNTKPKMGGLAIFTTHLNKTTLQDVE